MSSEITEQKGLDHNGYEIVECEGLCEEVVPEQDTRDVVSGSIIGQDSINGTIEVAGIGSGLPEYQRWCLECANYTFDTPRQFEKREFELIRRYITARTVTAFLLGMSVMLLLSSVLIV